MFEFSGTIMVKYFPFVRGGGRGTSTLDSAVPSELYLGHHFRKMDMSRAFTLGIQGPDGQRRVTISETESVDNLYKVTQKAYELPSATDFVLTKDLQKQIIIENTVNSNVSNFNLRHGDRLFLHYNRNISPTTSNDANEISADKKAQYDSKGLFFSHMPEFMSTLLYFCRVVRDRLPEHG